MREKKKPIRKSVQRSEGKAPSREICDLCHRQLAPGEPAFYFTAKGKRKVACYRCRNLVLVERARETLDVPDL